MRSPNPAPNTSPVLLRPTTRELLIARELPELVLADTALAILLVVLSFEHACIDEPHENDPSSLREARRLSRRIEAHRLDLQRYRDAVLTTQKHEGELPF